MLSHRDIERVILDNVFSRSDLSGANKIAQELGLKPGDVILGAKTICIKEHGAERHFQIAAEGNKVIAVDPTVL